ncbi:MAG TPA: aminotransferase class V-fold PLP-dependent enzyme [Terriglobales bacterium]|nr:aminotransferase class V-fold PLP-dependent enzyme [Terriglobales bacterium]
MLDRRRFLLSSAAIAAASGLPSSIAQARVTAQVEDDPPLPPRELYDRDEEAYWRELRKQFLIPADEVYLNNGTVGSSPRPVLRAIFEAYDKSEQMAQADPEDYPIWGYASWNEYRDPLAGFVGATRDEIALVRNATEANNYIANGLEMQAGDEVLMSDQEHPGGEQPWQLRAKRYGIVIKKYQIPVPPKSPADILNRINDAITPRTRIVFTSHISTATGVVQPVKEIAALARSKNILSAFDGAHVVGMMPLNIHDIGCDMYTSSPHKWLQAPKGTGFFYIRPEVQDRVWNTIATEGWERPEIKAERFQRIGSSNLPTLAGLRAAIELANNIGMDRIERRHRQLADRMLADMTKRGAESWTSADPAMRCGIVTVNVPPLKRSDLENWLWQQKKIRIRGGEPSKLRLSTPYYLLPSDIDRYLAGFDEFKRAHA